MKMTVSFRYLAIVVALCCGFVHESSCQTSLSSQDQQELLNAHNHYRGIVTPTASDMQIMVWNDELAMVAQNHAEQCVFEHNADRVSQQSTFTSVGENLAATTGLANYTSWVMNWYDENQDYDFSSNTCTQVCVHYTQVVWATSNSLGCGAFRCAQLPPTAFSNALYLVCNYGPAGNLIGQRPYTQGTPCSACPQGLDYCVGNLCSATAANVMSTTTSTMDESGITTTAANVMSTTTSTMDESGITNTAANVMSTTPSTVTVTMDESGITTTASSANILKLYGGRALATVLVIVHAAFCGH